jgi:pimeloyl-ACP methyl ester carboxylesterase
MPVVLLHGIGSSSRSWSRQLADLSNDFKVIAWDAPGYGTSSNPPPSANPSLRTYVDSLLGILDSLGLGRVALLGHSMGGTIAQEFYRSYPERLRALILADTSFGGTPDEW